jgi:hypothetical protein
VCFLNLIFYQEHENGRSEVKDGVPLLGECLQMANVDKSVLQIFVDLMVAHDFRDAQQQASISWVHLAKIFAFVLKKDKAFMTAVFSDLEEKYVKTLVKTKVWVYFLAEENAKYFAYVEKIHSRGVQDNQFISPNDQSRPQPVPQSTRDGKSGNRDDTREEKSVPNKESLLVKQRRLVNYVCRASTQNLGIQFLQTVVILQELFQIWPALESHLPHLLDEHHGAIKKKINPLEMEARTEQTKSARILAALRRTWHGNLLKFPSLIHLKNTLAKWRKEEEAKGISIESFSSQHSYHMERLREAISAWHIYENTIWPFMWGLLTEIHRNSIEQLVKKEHVGAVTIESEDDRKQKRIEALDKDKLLTVRKLKTMCDSANAIYKVKSSRKGLIQALVDKEYSVNNATTGTTSYNLLMDDPFICLPLFTGFHLSLTAYD